MPQATVRIFEEFVSRNKVLLEHRPSRGRSKAVECAHALVRPYYWKNLVRLAARQANRNIGLLDTAQFISQFH